MTAALESPPLIGWLRRQRRLAWQAILLWTLLRIGTGALASDATSDQAAIAPPAAVQACHSPMAPPGADTPAPMTGQPL